MREGGVGARLEAGFFFAPRRVPLRRMMLLLLLLALLPLGALALLQGMARLDRDSAAIGERLRESALFTAFAEQSVVDAAEGVLRLLSENPDIRGGDAEICSAKLREALSHFGAYANFSRTDANGDIYCSALPIQEHVALSADDMARIRAASDVYVTPPLWGAISHRRVIVMALPLHAANGRFEGAITTSIDLGWLQDSLKERYVDRNAVVILLDTEGRPIIASRDTPWKKLDISDEPGQLQEIRDPEGHSWVYATAPIASGGKTRFHVGYIARRTSLASADWWFVGGHVALPILALLFASAAILIGADWGILRWINSLRTLAAQYAHGNYRARDDAFDEAPQELRDLAASLYRMAHTIEQRDRMLRDTMGRQQALARELNHRVKNNLQIIGSLLSLQIREVKDEAGKMALSEARLRVGALALVHRLLYETDELSNVSTKRLLHDLCHLIHQNYGDSNIDIDCVSDDMPLDIDRAVPLTLWSVEALLLTIRRAESLGGRRWHIMLRLKALGDRACISVEDDMPANATAVGSPSSLRLLGAISQQLGGQLQRREGEGVSLVFPLKRLPSVQEQTPAEVV